MTTTIQICALSLAIATTAAWAQDEASSSENQRSTWRENTIARCLQQYSAEQCQDNDFLEENFHINSLEVAHRAAIRRNKMAEKAMHEVILQHACNDSPSKVCGDDDSIQCLTEVTQTCIALKTEANTCIQNAKQSCALVDNPTGCFQQQKTQCPSEKKQPIEQLLAKYPKLTASQKTRLVETARALDAKTRGWWSNLVTWIKNPL